MSSNLFSVQKIAKFCEILTFNSPQNSNKFDLLVRHIYKMVRLKTDENGFPKLLPFSKISGQLNHQGGPFNNAASSPISDPTSESLG